LFYRFAFGFGGKKSQKSAKSVDRNHKTAKSGSAQEGGTADCADLGGVRRLCGLGDRRRYMLRASSASAMAAKNTTRFEVTTTVLVEAGSSSITLCRFH
jgi:hypothetical protein